MASYRKGYHFYSPQSSTVIKSKMATTTILRTQTRFRPPKVRLHCRLPIFRVFFVLPFLQQLTVKLIALHYRQNKNKNKNYTNDDRVKIFIFLFFFFLYFFLA